MTSDAPRPAARRPGPSRRAIASLGAVLLACAALAPLPACRHTYGVENREAPVHVWIDVPAARTAEQRVELEVTVAGRPAASGIHVFPAGRPRQELPPVYVRAGNHPVVVSRGGRVVAQETVPVGHVTWILVTVDGAGASIARSRFEPGTMR